MNKAEHIDIHIAFDQGMNNKALVNAWKKAGQGKRPEGVEHPYIEDTGSLLKVLSDQRLISLSSLLRSGHTSIRALSKKLQRNCKNVHFDVQARRSVGLIRLDEQDSFFVSWHKTARGNLGQKFCREAAVRYRQKYPDTVFLANVDIRTETSFEALHVIRLSAQLGDLVRKYKGRVLLEQQGLPVHINVAR